jgi:hypothetical protein
MNLDTGLFIVYRLARYSSVGMVESFRLGDESKDYGYPNTIMSNGLTKYSCVTADVILQYGNKREVS